MAELLRNGATSDRRRVSSHRAGAKHVQSQPSDRHARRIGQSLLRHPNLITYTIDRYPDEAVSWGMFIVYAADVEVHRNILTRATRQARCRLTDSWPRYPLMYITVGLNSDTGIIAAPMVVVSVIARIAPQFAGDKTRLW